MTDTEHITPIDRLMSMMEDWERDLSADWYTYPIVIFAGEKNQVEYYFQKNKSGRSRFTKMLELHDCSAQELHAICKRELSRRGFSVEGEADKKLLGYFRYLVKNRKLTFRNAHAFPEPQHLLCLHRSSRHRPEGVPRSHDERALRHRHY